MKVAILLSGQLRNIERGFQFIRKNLMEGYDCDVFIHAWYNEENTDKKFSPWWNSKLIKDDNLKVLDLYNPVSHLIEPQIKFDKKNYDASQFEGDYRVDATLSMFYSIKKCNELKTDYEKENNMKYDVVVRSRFDLAILTKIKYEEHDFINNIFFKDDCSHEKNICMNDHFAFGSSENMDHYCSTFDSIEDLYVNYNTPFNPETFLGRNLRILKKINCIGIPISSGIIRDNTNNFYISGT